MDLFKPKPKPKPIEAIEERVTLPGIDATITHSLRIVWLTDQISSVAALQDLEDWLRVQGYFLYAVSATEKK